MPYLAELPDRSRIQFSESYAIYDQVQLRWIDIHSELLFKLNKIVTGMKVKMYVPKTNLWCWVIVDKNNEVMVFERDISWNFYAIQRNTQMWLHDQWLVANRIQLSPIIP